MDKFYLSKSKVMQTFGTLQGLIDGISADNKILPKEVEALRHWLQNHDHISNRPPFTEIIQTIKVALEDNKISDSELKDIRFVCQKVMATLESSKTNTNQIQKLHGIASGIASDGDLNSSEWSYLQKWITNNSELKGSWPFDEIEALTTKHRSSELLTTVEKEVILHYLNDFCGFNGNSALTHPLNEPSKAITGICAVCPDIIIPNKTFCLTGNSKKHPRKKIVEMISSFGGKYKDDMSKQVDYLIVCAEGSSMWTYSCYGRKVEDAVNLRKQGHHVLVIHEFDLWDSLEDAA